MPKGKKNKRLGKRKRELVEPGRLLKGKNLWRAANAMSRIELRPSLKAYGRQYKRYKRDQKRDTRALRNLGDRTDRKMRNLYRSGDEFMAGQSDAARARGEALVKGVADTASGISDAQVKNASEVIGGQINSLANQMIQPGYSASQNALANAAAEANARQQNTSNAWNALAQVSAKGGIDTAANRRAAMKMRGKESRSDMRYMIGNRIADTVADYGEAKREVAGKIADTKALFGPTRLKNIMQLRGTERDFQNARAQILSEARMAAADRKLGWAELQEDIRSNKAGEANDRRGDGGGDGGKGGELWDRPNKLGPNEYKILKNAAGNYIGGKKVKNWQGVADELRKNTDASETEIRKAIARLKKKYR